MVNGLIMQTEKIDIGSVKDAPKLDYRGLITEEMIQKMQTDNYNKAKYLTELLMKNGRHVSQASFEYSPILNHKHDKRRI